jgi:hypothetical protein
MNLGASTHGWNYWSRVETPGDNYPESGERVTLRIAQGETQGERMRLTEIGRRLTQIQRPQRQPHRGALHPQPAHPDGDRPPLG